MARKYTDEFKQDAVGPVGSGIAQKWVRADPGVSKSAMLARVAKARYERHGPPATADAGTVKTSARAPGCIRELEIENEVPRRAAGYSSRANLKFPK